MSTYSELLRNPHWQKKRLEILNRDQWSCDDCGDGLKTNTVLHVHHKEYIFGRAPWDYDNDNFETLCAPCHRKRHTKPDAQEKSFYSVYEDKALIAAFTILSADLRYEIQRLFKDDAKIEHQVNFLVNYENVKVEEYLVFYTINTVATPEQYQTASASNDMLNIELSPYYQYHYKCYYDLRINTIKRVLDSLISEQVDRLKTIDNIEDQMDCLKENQKLLMLRTRFLKSVR